MRRLLETLLLLGLLVALCGCGACPLATRDFWLGSEEAPAGGIVDGLEYPYSGYYYLGHDEDPRHRVVAPPAPWSVYGPGAPWSLLLPYADEQRRSALDSAAFEAYK